MHIAMSDIEASRMMPLIFGTRMFEEEGLLLVDRVNIIRDPRYRKRFEQNNG
jgi:hypothetical protein